MDWDSIIQNVVQPVFRWLHVIAGVMWIGHLYFFNFVNGHLAKTYDADTKKKVVPQLMPRALYFFRWGAAWTWLTGFILLSLIYYNGNLLVPDGSTMSNGMVSGISIGAIILVFFIYDALWNMIKNETAAAVVSYVLIVAALCGLSQILTGRALYIHLGGLFGTIMAMNVWMRIWPAQKKIIAGIKGTGPAPDAAVAAMAGLRSKHNTYLSIPLLFMMISNHYPVMYGGHYAWVCAAGVVLLGWGLTKWMYVKSASPVTLEIGDGGAAPKA